ncbi:hypothetical protein C0J52_10789 [Blattella germanica]|nr:hypothetical protein C0J52_10789 [Blattella germanica]
MQRRWHKKRIVCVCLVAVFLYLILRTQKKNAVIQFKIDNSRATDIWEFVADFSNMKKLNPTILEFNILAESGNYDHWQYSVEYTEFLSSYPFIHNFIVSHFNVKPADKGAFVIQATHSSCFYTRLACLSSESEFRFEQEGSNTNCIENITYECPFAFSSLCHREVMYQRTKIKSNLQSHFSVQKMQSKNM